MPANSRFAVAVHVLTLMGCSEDEPVKSDDMACSVNTHPVVIRRILCALSKAELISSQTGASGGSRLARKPGKITLLDVYRAVEGGDAFALHRQPPDPHCRVGANIAPVLEDILSRVGVAVEQVLAKITVEEIVQTVRRHSKSSKK